jgi:amino acid adenylation domain-containing protein/non-ribosomal peptide synthase protein (TIGR01720 family)
VHRPSGDALRVLLLDLTQYFTHDTDMLYDVVEPPLGTMYIMTYLKEQLGEKVDGKILKSRIDFDSYEELKKELEAFKPDVIGVRSLTFYRDFFHKTIGLMRQWGFEGPIIAGGPYATRNPNTLIQDRHIDLLVLSEGEWTFCDIISRIIKNNGRLPGEEELRTIDGIVFLPRDAVGARELVLLDTLEEIVSQKPVENLAPINQSLDMAYIVFTSGSTGKPKGVIIDHRNVANVLTWFARTYNIKPGMRIIQLSNYTFDPSVEQIFSTLLHGAELYIGKRQLTADKETFRQFVNQHQIDIINFIPGALNHLLGDEERLESVKTVISGGEKLEEEWKNRIIKKGYPLYNQYGPTENTIDALMEKCSEAKVTLGRPIANVQCYILQPNNTLAPIGVKGELYIGGTGLTRGYLNNPGLTSDKFPAGTGDHVPRSVQGRTYRTGDLVRWLPNGTIEFIGRMDHQVKIRGLRIELGEIETHLQAHSKIKEAVVNPVHIDQETTDTRLCGYFVSDLELTPTELRDYLALELPEYMIPTYFVRLEKLPLNPNGKLDRRALPDPEDTTTTRRATEYEAPQTDVEKKLAEIWESVLGKEKVGVNENFFGLGGDSVKSIQILSRLNKAGYKIEMTDIFQYPTISQLAPLATTVERAADQSDVTGVIPLTPVQKHFFLHHNTDPHHFNRAVILHFRQGVEEAAVRDIFTRVQSHHDTLRMTYKIGEEGAVIQTNQGLDMPISLEVNDLRGQETAVKMLKNKTDEIRTSIDLENGPLMKLGLFHLDDGDRLLIVIHHLVIDSISWRILFEDINSLYNQYKENKRGEALELPRKTDSFKVLAEKLSQHAASDTLLEEKTLWKHLENTHVSPLPVDFDSPGERRDDHQLSFRLEKKETRQLLTNVNDAYGTETNDILLTALGLALKETFHLDRFRITLEDHERENIFKPVNVTRTVGCFTTLFPVILDLSYEENLARQVKEVKDHLHRLPNRGLGYGILRYLTPPEHKEDIEFTHTPRIGFSYLGLCNADLEGKSFEMAAESPDPAKDPYNRQGFELEVSGIISKNCLSVSIAYNRNQYKPHTIETLMGHFKTKLEQVITFCSEREEKEMTPSDMDYKELTVEELDSIFD